MRLRTVTKISNISKRVSLRCDPKYCYFWDHKKGIAIENKPNLAFLKDYLLPYEKRMIQKGELEDERYIIELSDVENRTSIILLNENGEKRITSKLESTKLDLADCDIVFNRLEPYLGKIIINDPSEHIIGTSEWIPFKFKPGSINKLFIKYLLLTPPLLDAYWNLKSGKRHARIREWDLTRILLPIPDIKTQNRIAEKIQPIENKMIAIYRAFKKPVDIVNDVFAKEFRFNMEDYKKLKEIRYFIRHPLDITKTVESRISVKFQHPAYEYLPKILAQFDTVKLRMLCSTPIHRGIQPIYDSDGDVYIIKTLNLKHSYLDLAEADFVNRDFYEKNKNSQIVENDILISSTGEGRGKVDIYKEDRDAIADSHISIVRIKEYVNPMFIIYYFRSLIGKMILDLSEIAIKGTPEIYSSMLEKAPVISIGRQNQDRVVKEIETKLVMIQQQRRNVEMLRNEIDNILLTELATTTLN